MGNKAIADRVSSASKVDLVSKFNIEELIDDALLDSIYETFKSSSGIYPTEDGDEASYKQDFTEFNEQKNEDLQELTKDRVIKEINEAITTGFSTPDFFLEELKEPSKFLTRKYPKCVSMFRPILPITKILIFNLFGTLPCYYRI